jgi:hypothetical protein
LNLIALLALIFKGALVSGLIPERALRRVTEKVPNPTSWIATASLAAYLDGFTGFFDGGFDRGQHGAQRFFCISFRGVTQIALDL